MSTHPQPPTTEQVIDLFTGYMDWPEKELMDENLWEIQGHYLELQADGSWVVEVQVFYEGTRDDPPDADSTPIGTSTTLMCALKIIAESELAERLASIDEAIFPPTFDLECEYE